MAKPPSRFNPAEVRVVVESEKCPFCKKGIESGCQTCPHCGSLLNGGFKHKPIEPGVILSDRYNIIKELGKGGMGTVYLAEETTLATGRYVAIKLLPAHMTTDKQILTRFQEEIKTAAGLDHPHIVPIYFVGEHEGLYYFVMKYLEGGTVHQLVRRQGPFSEEDARKILATVCDALYYAHNRGIIHRDIKAGNIMVSPEGITTLMDFGVARKAEVSELTLPGQIVGTAEYMAPEQWYGEAEYRSDIYSLGIVMHFMLTGKLPFKSKNAFELMKMHQENDPVPVSALKSDMSPQIEAICSWCLQKEKDKRPENASILAACLRGETSPPSEYVVDSSRRRKEHDTATITATEEEITGSKIMSLETKVANLLALADQAYGEGNLKKAMKLARRAGSLGGDSGSLDYRLKKYEHLHSTLEDIKERTDRKITDGFIRDALRDLETVLQVYDIPEIRQRRNKAQARVDYLNTRFAEGKKLRMKGKFHEAYRCFEEVAREDAENCDALQYKQEIYPKLAKIEVVNWKTYLKRYKWLLVLLLSIGLLSMIVVNIPVILQNSANYFHDKKQYASPPMFNTYDCYQWLDRFYGPDPERQAVVNKMVQELLEKGNIALKEDRLKMALEAYTEARRMMKPESADREMIDGLIAKIETQLKFK